MKDYTGELSNCCYRGIFKLVLPKFDEVVTSQHYMTAYAHDELVKDGLEEGVMAVLDKPLDINALLSFFSALRKERKQLLAEISRRKLAGILGQPVGKRK